MAAPERTDAQRLLEVTRGLLLGSLQRATEDFDRVEGLIKGAVAELAESFLTIEGLVREQRDRLEQARAVLSEEAGESAAESIRFAIEEQVETSTTVADSIENQVSSAMRSLQFEDIASQVLTGALARLARVAETIEASGKRNPEDVDGIVAALELALEEAEDPRVPAHEDLSAGAGKLF